MKKKLFFILILFIGMKCSLGDVFALEIESQSVEIAIANSFVSRYIWRGQDLYANNDPAYQPEIDICFPGLLEDTEIAFNIWGSFPMSSGHENAEELDYAISFSRDISEDYNLSFGYTYFDFPNTASTADAQEPWLSFTLNKIPQLPIDVAITVFAGYDFKAQSGGPDEGWYYSWGFSTDLPLPEALACGKDQALSLGIVNWGNDGVADLKPCGLYATELSLSTIYLINDFGISPSLNYVINHEDKINSGNEEFWLGVEISYSF